MKTITYFSFFFVFFFSEGNFLIKKTKPLDTVFSYQFEQRNIFIEFKSRYRQKMMTLVD